MTFSDMVRKCRDKNNGISKDFKWKTQVNDDPYTHMMPIYYYEYGTDGDGEGGHTNSLSEAVERIEGWFDHLSDREFKRGMTAHAKGEEGTYGRVYKIMPSQIRDYAESNGYDYDEVMDDIGNVVAEISLESIEDWTESQSDVFRSRIEELKSHRDDEEDW